MSKSKEPRTPTRPVQRLQDLSYRVNLLRLASVLDALRSAALSAPGPMHPGGGYSFGR